MVNDFQSFWMPKMGSVNFAFTKIKHNYWTKGAKFIKNQNSEPLNKKCQLFNFFSNQISELGENFLQNNITLGTKYQIDRKLEKYFKILISEQDLRQNRVEYFWKINRRACSLIQILRVLRTYFTNIWNLIGFSLITMPLPQRKDTVPQN